MLPKPFNVLEAIERTLGQKPELMLLRLEATRDAMVGYLRVRTVPVAAPPAFSINDKPAAS